MNILIHAKLPRFTNLFSLFYLLIFCQSCDQADLTAGQEQLRYNSNSTERAVSIGRSLDKEFPKNLLNFGSQQTLTDDQIDIIRTFVQSMEGGSFIFGGNPDYFIEINRAISRYISGGPSIKLGFGSSGSGEKPTLQYEYTVYIREADSGRLVRTGQAKGICLDVETVASYPPSCISQNKRLLYNALQDID